MRYSLGWLGAFCFLVWMAWIAGVFEKEDFTEAHDLYEGNGVWISPEEHEQRMDRIQHERKLNGQTNSR